MRGSITAELIGNQTHGPAPLPFHQLAKKPLSGSAITTSLDEDLDHVAILIDGAPEVLTTAADLHEDLVEMPYIAELWLAPTGSGGVFRPEPLTPATDRLVGHLDASLGQEILDITKAQGEAVIEPHGVADDLRREPVPAVAR